MRLIKKPIAKPGDTMIEVMFAIAVFALVSVLSVMVMNSGVATVEATLELSVARNEIDAQSEALRFIHNSFLSERGLLRGDWTYAKIWGTLRNYAKENTDSSGAILPLNLSDLNPSECSGRYADAPGSIFRRRSIILNTRKIDPNNPDGTIIRATSTNNVFTAADLSPRLVFTKAPGSAPNINEDAKTSQELYEGDRYTYLAAAKGIWIIPIESAAKSIDDSSKPEFYDFHIYTCWNAPGRTRPTTIGTIMRLYNPELIEVSE